MKNEKKITNLNEKMKNKLNDAVRLTLVSSIEKFSSS